MNGKKTAVFVVGLAYSGRTMLINNQLICLYSTSKRNVCSITDYQIPDMDLTKIPSAEQYQRRENKLIKRMLRILDKSNTVIIENRMCSAAARKEYIDILRSKYGKDINIIFHYFQPRQEDYKEWIERFNADLKGANSLGKVVFKLAIKDFETPAMAEGINMAVRENISKKLRNGVSSNDR